MKICPEKPYLVKIGQKYQALCIKTYVVSAVADVKSLLTAIRRATKQKEGIVAFTKELNTDYIVDSDIRRSTIIRHRPVAFALQLFQ
jgi:hypothetical protein